MANVRAHAGICAHYCHSVYVGAYGVIMGMEGTLIEPFLQEKLKASQNIRLMCGRACVCICAGPTWGAK